MTIKNLVFAANNETLVGEEWSLLYDRGSSSYRSICWDGSKFVAAAQYRTIRSSDGIDWTIEKSNLPATQIRRLEYGNGVYVAATNSGYFVSSDLISWTQVLNAFKNPYALRFKYGKFYSVVGTSFMSSTDGINWTTISSNSMTEIAQDIEFASESNIVIVGFNSFITSSSDGGLTWINQTSPIANRSILGIARSNSLYVARTSTQIITSPDGITWTVRTSNLTSTLFWIHWSGSLFTLVGTGENATSTDGINWTRRVVSGNYYCITSSPTTHVMVGENAIVSSSSDGLTYTRRDRIPSLNFSFTDKGSIIWDGSRYVSTSIGASAGISYSTNLRDWTLSTNSSTVDSDSSNLCYNGSVYVAGGNRLMYTNNLTSNWTESSYPVGTGFSRKIIWDGSKFVAAGGLSSSSAKTNIVTRFLGLQDLKNQHPTEIYTI